MYKNHILFINSIENFKLKHSEVLYKIDCKKCDTKNNLFKVFANVLKFPDYFGYNWDAFDECVYDLEWIKDEMDKNTVYIYMYNCKDLLKNSIDKEIEIFFDIVSKDDTYIDNFNNPISVKFVFDNKDINFIDKYIK